MALMPALGKVNEISEPLLKYYFDGRISLIGMNKNELTQTMDTQRLLPKRSGSGIKEKV